MEARKALQNDEVPVGTVIVCGERIIARGYNLTETLNDVTAHAEIQTITSAANFLGSKYLNNCTIYVTMEPCSMCAGAIGWSQISRLVYGCKDEKKGYQLYKPSLLHPKTLVTGRILEEECSSMITDFFKRKRQLK